MLTPKKRDNLAHLQEQMSEIETVLGRLNRRLNALLNQLEHIVVPSGKGRFEQPEVARLMTLNRRLAELEQHLRDQAHALEPRLRAKLADPTNRMYDYEIDAEIAYALREDDEEAVDDDEAVRLVPLGVPFRSNGQPGSRLRERRAFVWLAESEGLRLPKRKRAAAA